MKLTTFSYRFAEEVLVSLSFRNVRDEVLTTLQALPPIPYGQKLWSKKAIKPSAKRPIEQAAMNRWLDTAFHPKGWEVHSNIISGSGLAADYREDRVRLKSSLEVCPNGPMTYSSSRSLTVKATLM